MNKELIKGLFILVAFVFVGSFLIKHTSALPMPTKITGIKIAGEEIKVDVVVTKEAKKKGLSGREKLEENEGMLFVFETSGYRPFWMKDMNFPIDMIWIDRKMKVVFIKENALPESFPESYGGEYEAKYVLEVVSGFAEKNNLKVGDEVIFTY